MKKLNKNTKISIATLAIILLLNRLIGLPDIVHGLGVGAVIGFMLFEIYSTNHDISKFKNLKRNFLKM